MGWQNDAMTIQFAHTKTDREGKDSGFKRHIYANPESPEICPILSVARYRMAFPSLESGRLFPGQSQYDSFRKLLSRVVSEHAEQIWQLGIDPANIGVHSIHKGAATYCCNGTTAGVSFVAVYVQAGWTMGNVKDRYLQHQAAGDQLCGRTVTGLDMNSEQFAISPPHFVVSDEDSGIKGCYAALVDLAIGMVKRGSRLDGCILFPHGLFDDILPHSRTCLPWRNNNSVLHHVVFTGIPPAVVDFYYHRQQLEMMRELPEQMVGLMREEMDSREMGGGELTIQRLRTKLIDPVEERLVKHLEGLSPSIVQASTNKPKTKSKIDWQQGQFRTVPKDYILNTKLSCLDVWICWHLGEDKRGIMSATDSSFIEYSSPPWKTLQLQELKKMQSMKMYLSNLKLLCCEFDKAAGLTTMSCPSLIELRSHFKTEPVQAIIQSVSETKKGRKRCVEQIRWKTLARQLRKKKGQSSTGGTRRKQKIKPKSSTSKAKCVKIEMKPMPVPIGSKKCKAAVIEKVDSDSDNSSFCEIGKTIKGGEKEYTERAQKQLKRKQEEHQRQAACSGAFAAVHGPMPAEPDCGYITLGKRELCSIAVQGSMLAGVTTTAYLNVLSKEHYHAGVRRSGDNFYTQLRAMCEIMDQWEDGCITLRESSSSS